VVVRRRMTMTNHDDDDVDYLGDVDGVDDVNDVAADEGDHVDGAGS